MPNPRLRIDQLPMHRRASAHGAGEGVAYERREVDPDAEELSRRTGSTRQARFSTALGFVAEQEGARVVIDNEFDLTGNWSIAFSANVGDILDTTASEYWTLVFAGATSSADADNSIHVYLDRSGSDYQINLVVTDNSSGTYAATTPSQLTVTPGDDVDFLITRSGNTITLNVDTSSATVDVSAATLTGLDECQVELLGSHKATNKGKGTAPVLDNFHIFGSVVTTAVYGDRSPGSSFSILPSDIGGTAFSPASASYNVYLHPSPPQLLGSAVNFSGFGGAVRVPFRSIFERYFQTQTEEVGSKTFAFRVAGTVEFLGLTSTIIDFGSDTPLAYLRLDAGVAKFKYGDVEVNSAQTLTKGSSYEIFCGVDGTNVFISVDGEAVVTSAISEVPRLELERIPDLYIGNDEDPTADKHYHGSLTTFQFYDYAAKTSSTTAAAPVVDLDFSADTLRDKGPNRVALEQISHATTEGQPLYTDGPLDDQDFQAVQQEVVLGPSAVGYTGKYAAPITSDASSVRAGDRAYIHSGDYVHVLNSELSQIRPLGIPEPGSEVSCRNVGAGALDGVYQYGYRYQSQDGTYGPMKRLKPLTAFSNTGVLVGSGDAADENRELGESYGKTDESSGSQEYFSITDTADAIHGDIVSGSNEDLSVESFLAFPDFEDLEETVFDRGVTGDFTDVNSFGIQSDTEIDIDPNSDFTLQCSFKLDISNLNENTLGENNQGIFSLGTQSGGGKTRSFMLFLSIDSAYATSAPRMVAARAVGDKDSRYKYLIFNNSGTEGDDSSLWVDGTEYTVTAVRDGDDLIVNVWNGSTWTEFSGGELVGFFEGYNAPTRVYAFNAFGVKTDFEQIAALPATGWSNGTYGTKTYGTGASGREARRIHNMDRDATFFHARAWSRAWPTATLQAEANKRFAAVDGALTDRVKSDVGVFDQDPSANPKQFFDKAATVYWKTFKQDEDDGSGTASGDKNPPSAATTQVKGSPTEYDGVVMTDSGIQDVEAAQYRIYASSVNNGSIIVSTNDASFIIAKKPWDDTSPGTVTQLLGPGGVDIDPKNFNWFTTTVNFSAVSASALRLTVNNLYVNGNKFFDTPLNRYDTDIVINTQNLVCYLGGFNYSPAAVNDGEVNIGEFRVWKTDRYDDTLTEAFDYLTGRVAESEVSNMYIYARFQPSDLDSGNNYNLHPLCFLNSEDYISTNAELIDTRAGEGGSETDPAPAIGIPKPPYPWITAVQVFRTEGFIVQDQDSKLEIEQALELVQGQPAYFLARIPAGDTSYIDIVPDDTLGYEAPEGGEGFTVEKPNGVCIWQNQLALFRGNTLYFSERGPYGWESFPSWASYAVPTSGSGSDIVGAVEIGSSLLVCGKSWATMLSGAPSQPRPFDLGPGTGAQSARCIAVHGGIAYALGNGKLWRVGQDGGYDDQFSQPVHDILPTQGRVAVVGALSSLLVIDEQSDQVLRFHFPTQAWSIEERDALGVGDQGSDYLVVHQVGSYSKGSAVYGDDVAANTVATSTGTKASNSTITLIPDDTNPNAVAGTRVLVVDDSGNEAVGDFTSYSSPTVTVTADLSGLSGNCTIYYGVGQTGMMVDTGWFAVGSRNSDLSLFTDVTSGSFDYSLAGTDTPGDRSNRTGLSFTDLGTAYESTGTGGRGRYVRAVVRNRTAQSASLGHAEVEVKVEQQAS